MIVYVNEERDEPNESSVVYEQNPEKVTGDPGQTQLERKAACSSSFQITSKSFQPRTHWGQPRESEFAQKIPVSHTNREPVLVAAHNIVLQCRLRGVWSHCLKAWPTVILATRKLK